MTNECRKNDNPILGFVVIGFCLIFSLIGYGYAVNETRTEHADHQSKIHHENATKYIEGTCITLNDAALHECIEKAIKTSGEYQRAEKDLIAQSQMAKWAFALLVLSAFGIGITGLGVIYVRDTLTATTDAIKATNQTNELMRNEQRPWIAINDINVRLKEFRPILVEKGKHEACYIVDVNLKNHGNSPALRVSHNVRAYLLTQDHPPPFSEFIASYNVKPRPEICIPPQGIHPRDIDVQLPITLFSEEFWSYIVIDVVILYSSHIENKSDKIHRTAQRLILGYNKDYGYTGNQIHIPMYVSDIGERNVILLRSENAYMV